METRSTCTQGDKSCEGKFRTYFLIQTAKEVIGTIYKSNSDKLGLIK